MAAMLSAAMRDKSSSPESTVLSIKRFIIFGLVALIVLALAIASPGRTTTRQITPGTTTGQDTTGEKDEVIDVGRIVRAFTQKETEFRRALNAYTFKRDAVVQTIGMGGQITGEYNRVSQFTFNDASERFERITYFPQPTLTEISFTNEDLEDLGGVQPFALEASKIDQYDLTYVGKEKLDELNTYVFNVAPKFVPKKVSERFFQGRVWVDDHDLQIVKVKGKGVPEGKQRFPTFETYREQIDGKYWFPTYTYADDELTFKTGQSVHLRMRIKFTDFELLRGRATVIEQGDENKEKNEEPDKPKPTPTPPAPKPKP
ncbi:MAG: hypothetical protein QOH49_299 [Acidobacteriota bacterium]|nr:hypothetical protein [Acidobacteriota bacterium]